MSECAHLAPSRAWVGSGAHGTSPLLWRGTTESLLGSRLNELLKGGHMAGMEKSARQAVKSATKAVKAAKKAGSQAKSAAVKLVDRVTGVEAARKKKRIAAAAAGVATVAAVAAGVAVARRRSKKR